MKYKTTRKQVLNSCQVALSVGYCDLQNLLCLRNADCYTCGVYGWNADVYYIDGLAIVTGYRPFGKNVDYKLIRSYENNARIVRECGLRYDHQKDALDKLLEDFVRAATAGKEEE